MTYEVYCANSEKVSKRVNEFNEWRKAAVQRLLTDIALRVARVGTTGYCGCGFHYDKEQTLGSLLMRLSLPWQVDANSCENFEKENISAVCAKVRFEQLIKSVEKAEACIAANATGKCTCLEDRKRDPTE